jgi:hypothetical protein
LTCTAFVCRSELLVSPIVLWHVVKIAQTQGKPQFKVILVVYRPHFLREKARSPYRQANEFDNKGE